MSEPPFPGSHCYCNERLGNPELRALLSALPDGFCGTCDTCGQPGHSRAHPYRPVSGSWCDEHWAGLLTRRSFYSGHVIEIGVTVLFVIALVVAVLRALS